MSEDKILNLYQGHLAIQRRIKNETLSEQLQRERSVVSGNKDLLCWTGIAAGSLAVLPMFMTDNPLGYQSAFMGTVLIATSTATLAEKQTDKIKSYINEVLGEVKIDMLAIISQREGIAIEDIQKPVDRSKAELVDMAVAKHRGLAGANYVPGLRFYIESKYAAFHMTAEQRSYFDNAVRSFQDIPVQMDYSLDDMKAALIGSKSGAITITRDGFVEMQGSRETLLRGHADEDAHAHASMSLS
jgi:hypothetical protein